MRQRVTTTTHKQQRAATASMTMRSSSLVALTLLLCLCVLVAEAYNVGDIVPAKKRSQFKKQRTLWNELIASQSPRFGINRAVHLALPQDAFAGLSATPKKGVSEDYKFAFEFGGSRATPWILVYSPGTEAKLLTQLVFTFTHSKGVVRSLRYETQYDTITDASPPTGGSHRVAVVYRWVEEVGEPDISYAATTVAFLAVCGSLFAGWYIWRDTRLQMRHMTNSFT